MLSSNQESTLQQKQQKNDSEEKTQSYQVKNVEPFVDNINEILPYDKIVEINNLRVVDSVSETLFSDTNAEVVEINNPTVFEINNPTVVDRVSEILPYDKNVEFVEIHNPTVVDRVSETLSSASNVEIVQIYNKDKLDNIYILQHQSSTQSLSSKEEDNSTKCSNMKTSSTITNLSTKKRR